MFDEGRLVAQHEEFEMYETSPGRFTLRVDGESIKWGMSYSIAREMWRHIIRRADDFGEGLGLYSRLSPLSRLRKRKDPLDLEYEKIGPRAPGRFSGQIVDRGERDLG